MKIIVGIFGSLCVVITIVILVAMFNSPKESFNAELTTAETFAEKNDISVGLAESVEQAIGIADCPSKLVSLKDWEQIEDFADGQRYTAWSYSNKNEKYYHLVFYVINDEVVTIRDELEVLYEK